ncbi:MAG: exo-beta-N-acetylmuramidase NamZ domain-containing protein [Candidatus Izemoplasmatales bacterium]
MKVLLAMDHFEDYLPLFEGKRVGLMTNPTGVNSALISTIDILKEKVNLVALFAPEHGVRGDLQAGVHAESYLDEATNLHVYSLYGATRHPSKEMMDLFDVLVFDIADVGARFYTYLYSMSYLMESCKEYGKQMIIIDHPNPVGADLVEGNLLQLDYRSFVGYYSIPQRYGLTIGELALLFNNEFEIHADIHILPMENYERKMSFRETGLPWVLPSPNIPTPETALVFLATCLFEGTNLSEGRGTTKPFHFIGSPYLNNRDVVCYMNGLKLTGVLFRETYFTPTFSKHQNTLCHGLEVVVTNEASFQPVKTGYLLFDYIRKTHKEFDYIPPFREGGHPFIDLLTGNNLLRENQIPVRELLMNMHMDTEVFSDLKRRYHLYE